MKQTLLSCVSLSFLLLTGCQECDTKTHAETAKISKPLQKKMQQNPTPSSPSHQKNSSYGLGIIIEDDKIIIDTAQTKTFLKDIEQKIQNSFQRIEKNLRKEQIKSPDETGIVITDTTLKIDLNKTKNFMEKWIHSMESVAREINNTMQEIEQSLP